MKKTHLLNFVFGVTKYTINSLNDRFMVYVNSSISFFCQTHDTAWMPGTRIYATRSIWHKHNMTTIIHFFDKQKKNM